MWRGSSAEIEIDQASASHSCRQNYGVLFDPLSIASCSRHTTSVIS
jgi:hypothetical protein